MHRDPALSAEHIRIAFALTAALMTLVSCRPAPLAPGPSLEKPLALFDGHGDIGAVKRPGGVFEEADGGGLVVEGGGANMWFGNDEGHFVWKHLTGDFIVSARVAFFGQGIEAHRKIGWMARSTTDPHSAHASVVVHGDGLTSLQFRRGAGADTEEVRLPISGADQVQLERRGRTFIMSAAKFGEPYASEQITEIELGDEVLVGLFVCSHNADVIEKARFTNVRITLPAPENFVPYQDYIGGTIELLEVDTGKRTAVFRSDRPIQAPNWTKDGRFLIYNADGLLYRFELATGKATKLDTGSATANNNDHVLSFDGKRLGISHHSADDKDESIIYTLPAKGGTAEAGHAQGAVLSPRLVARWPVPGLHGRTGR